MRPSRRAESWVRMSLDLTEKVVAFARLLRARGVPVSTAEEVDAAAAALEVGEGDLDLLKAALRAALVKRREHYRVFDELFEKFWGGGEVSGLALEPARLEVRVEGDLSKLDPVTRFLSVYSPYEIEWEGLNLEPGSRELARRIARGLRALRRLLALQPGRRMRRSRGGTVDFRAVMRESLRHFGEPAVIVRSRRKRSKSRIVALFDVSNSMREEWAWLQSAMAAFRGLPSGSYEVFAFSVRLVRLTETLQQLERPEEIGRVVHRSLGLWGSGTRIGESLEQLLERHPGLVTGRTGVLIVSDGWDLGDLEVLDRALGELRRRSGFLAWLTPHAASSSFKPEAAALRVAIRHVDLLAPTGVLEDPRALAKALRATVHRHRRGLKA